MRLHRERIIMLLFVAAFWIGVALLLTPRARAQSGGWISSGRQETTVDARYKRMYNATGIEIADGTVVMIDTVAATVGPQIPLGKGFRTWSGATSSFFKIVGLTVGAVPSYSPGRILVEGLHNNALMDASGITGFTRVRPSLTTAGALGSYALTDSTNQYAKAVGVFQRYINGTTLRAQVYVNFSGQVFSK
jgi:hypothetical protein